MSYIFVFFNIHSDACTYILSETSQYMLKCQILGYLDYISETRWLMKKYRKMEGSQNYADSHQVIGINM